MPDLSADQATPPAAPDFGDLKGKSARGALLTFASQALRFAISFGSQLCLAHLLLPAQFGLVAMASPVLGFVAIFLDFGLSQAIIQRESIDQEELSSLFWINFAASSLLCLCVIACAPLIQGVFHEPRVGPIVIALALLLPISGLTSQAMALLSRNLAFASLASVDIAASVVGASAAIGSALLGAGYWSLVIQQVAISLVTLFMVLPLSKWVPSRPRIDPRVGSLLRFGGHLTTFNIVSYFTLYFDNVLVGIFNGPLALGLFERAFRLILQPLSQITAPLSRIAIPMLSRMLTSPADYRRAYLRMLQMVLLITAPGLLCASLLANDVVYALLGPAWRGTAPILQWLSIAGAISAYTVASCWLLTTQGRVREQMHCGLISSTLILVSLACGFHWGPVGIAAAYAAFAPAVHGVYVWISTRSGPVTLRDEALASYPIAAAVAIAALSLWLARNHFTLLPSLAKVLLGAAEAYTVTMIVLLCIPAGRRTLHEIWNMRALLVKTRPA